MLTKSDRFEPRPIPRMPNALSVSPMPIAKLPGRPFGIQSGLFLFPPLRLCLCLYFLSLLSLDALPFSLFLSLQRRICSDISRDFLKKNMITLWRHPTLLLLSQVIFCKICLERGKIVGGSGGGGGSGGYVVAFRVWRLQNMDITR